ncbi:PAS domain-containing protein [Halanaerobium salsuginis]|uniref:PAS domain S-box-containing protein n=1 Tax=Halanaerobium salsuginis TaxID=29563 RepID=A0A1I4H2W9_9FIRM|nr:PAS domain-containing protein [Halanaerobium salsuginis]SFL36569.1 PAS domain S-box-containing protein [Halanaerobium salsuginis]
MNSLVEKPAYFKRLSSELAVLNNYYKLHDLKLIVINPEAELELFSLEGSQLFSESDLIKLETDIYHKLKNTDIKKNIINIITAKLAVLSASDSILLQLVFADYIYLVLTSDKPVKDEFLNSFQEQFAYFIEDLHYKEQIEINLAEKDLQNINLKKEKYITASALDSIPGSIIILDKKGEIVYSNNDWNKDFYRNGILASELKIGDNYLMSCEKEGNSGNKAALQVYKGILKVLNDKKQFFTFDYYCQQPIQKRWFRMYVSSFKGIGRYEILILQQEITDEIMAKQESENILDNLPAAIIKYNSDLQLNYFNQFAARLFKLEESNLQKSFVDLITMEGEISYAERLQNVAKTKERIEFKINYQQGLKAIYLTVILIPELIGNDLKSIIAIIPDHIQLDDLKIDVKQQKNQYMQLFNNFPEAIVLLDFDQRVININRSFQKLFAYRISELKNKKLDDFIVPISEQNDALELSYHVLQGENIARKVRRVNARGEEIELYLTAFPVLLNDNKMGVYAIYRELVD